MSQQNQSTVVQLPDVLDQEKIKLDADIQRAEQHQKQKLRMLEDRKAMPAGLSVGMTSQEDSFLEAQRRYLPESLTPWEREKRPPTDKERRQSKGTFMYGASVRCYYDTEDKHRKNVNNGWVPVKDEDGHQVMVGSCLMYKRSMDLTREGIRQAEALSTRRMRAGDPRLNQAAKEGGGEIKFDENKVTVKGEAQATVA